VYQNNNDDDSIWSLFMSVPIVLSIAGVIILLIGIMGGGIKAKEIEIPPIPAKVRIIASLVGVILIWIAIWQSSIIGQPSPTQTEATATYLANTTPVNSFIPDPSKHYSIQSVYSEKFLTVSDGSLDDNTPIIQSEWVSETHQFWQFEALDGEDSGYYYIHSVKSGKCLDVDYASQDDGTQIFQYHCTWTNNHKWKIIALGSGTFALQAKHSDKVLTISTASFENGVILIQETFNPNELRQQWKIKLGTR
jgi:hypothetical protein